MRKVRLEDAKTWLQEYIAATAPGEQIAILHNGEVVAVLTRSSHKSWPCKAGSAKDTGIWISPDFNAPLEDFRGYMQST